MFMFIKSLTNIKQATNPRGEMSVFDERFFIRLATFYESFDLVRLP